jgi:hypothetical protein
VTVNFHTSRAAVAQLDRASGFEPEGRGFESLRPRQNFSVRSRSVPDGQVTVYSGDMGDTLSLKGCLALSSSTRHVIAERHTAGREIALTRDWQSLL